MALWYRQMGKNCIPTRSMDAMHLLSVTRLVDWNQLHVICILYSFSNVQTCPKEHGPSEIWVEQERWFITMVPLVLKIKHDRHKSQFFFSLHLSSRRVETSHVLVCITHRKYIFLHSTFIHPMHEHVKLGIEFSIHLPKYKSNEDNWKTPGDIYSLLHWKK